VLIKDTSVTNVSVKGVVIDGGVVGIVKPGKLVVCNSSFINITTARRGGAFFLENITDVSISSCNFSKCVASGNGGAIAFSIGTNFELEELNFTNCSSTGGYGGALSSSSIVGGKKIHKCVFGMNKAFQSIGLDIFDSSNVGSAFYGKDTVTECKSISTSSSSYILFALTQVSHFFLVFFVYMYYCLDCIHKFSFS
jgi:hypothetical protein